VIIRHLVIRPITFKNAFNTFSATLIAFNNFQHSTNDALDCLIHKFGSKKARAFFKDFPVGGGAFFEKGPFCEIIY
jgi:hypothetical protein